MKRETLLHMKIRFEQQKESSVLRLEGSLYNVFYWHNRCLL